MTRIEKALSLLNPRATYARDVLLGRQSLSGSDLRGKAQYWSASYHKARIKAATACRDAGGHVRKTSRGKILLAWGKIPDRARLESCSVGECWKY